MSIIVNTGRVVIAESVSLGGLHVAWGPGDGAWTTPPAESISATALTGEIGRRIPDEIAFVTPNSGGDIVLPGGTFSRSVSPTRYLFISCTFDYTDAPTATIRQTGIFKGTTVVSGLPGGQRYFTPGQIVSPGKMLEYSNIVPIVRSVSNRETFKTVIEF